MARKVADIVRDNAVVYRRQLLAYAIKVCRDADVAEDLVQFAFAQVLASTADWVDGDAIHYLTQTVAHRWLYMARAKPTRGGARGRVSLEDAEEILKLSIKPSQQPAAELSEVLRAIDLLPERDRLILRMAGAGCENLEIGRAVGLTSQYICRKLALLRENLRVATGRERHVREPKSRYRGVRPHRNRWIAEHQSRSLGRLYLGTFATAEEAAMAFDVAALARHGDRATLNFPQIKQELAA